MIYHRDRLIVLGPIHASGQIGCGHRRKDRSQVGGCSAHIISFAVRNRLLPVCSLIGAQPNLCWRAALSTVGRTEAVVKQVTRGSDVW